jgi:hypothetical protein
VSRFLVVLLAVGLWAGTAAAEDHKPPPPPPAKPADKPELSKEDREVVENLELLETLGEAEDLELLMELSKDED